ncbi:COG1426 Predicted transcriptional regulator contains Xre-like HTH domain [Candidatus Nanopelagicaceae bacterium]
MSLGSFLRDARESSGLSLDALSAATSIRAGLLAEMESDNFKHCGGDTYARGHLRSIAAKIGADAQEMIRMYNEEHSAEHRAIHDLLVENNVSRMPKEGRKISWKVPAAFSIAILVVVSVAQIVITNINSETPSSVAVSAKPSASPTVSASPSASASPAASASSTSVASSEKSPGPVTLVISAVRGNSYIDIIVDGKKIEKGSIFQGDTKQYSGNSVISIYLSNPAGLDITHNGKKLAPLGAENQEVRRTFR